MKQTLMEYTPEICIIVLKRWSSIQSLQKNQKFVHYPLEQLNLSKWLANSTSQSSDSSMYHLVAVCNHMGSMNSGHYTCFCKNDNQHWYLYDDESVSMVPKEKVVTCHAYFLIYQLTQN